MRRWGGGNSVEAQLRELSNGYLALFRMLWPEVCRGGGMVQHVELEFLA